MNNAVYGYYDIALTLCDEQRYLQLSLERTEFKVISIFCLFHFILAKSIPQVTVKYVYLQ